MNTDNLILRETDNAPLINKEDTLLSSEIDGNFINIYNDFIALSNAEDTTLIYDIDRSYVIGEYATFDGKLWLAIDDSTGVTPDFGLEWIDVFPTILAHEKNKDTILDEGGTNETTVAEIRAFIDAGLTSTTNLSLSTKTATSFKIESSTGADVIIPQANKAEAGLLNATDKVKLGNLSGINSGDQTLVSLNAEDVDNKVTDFTTINDTLYPTTQAVDTYLTAQVPPLVETFLDGYVAQDLQSVTDIGNTTTDNIAFTGGVGVLFDNTSTLRKGTIDAGYGGAKGIAQICSVGYELKWEAGRLYVMGDGGTTIREVSHNFTTTPSATDDNTKGFIVGSRWILDNGDLYICSDVTTATAVWTLQSIDAVPTDGSNKAVESNGVFDALANKVDKVVGSRLITSAESTLLGNTSGTNTGDQTISDATITTTDITTNNFTTAKHGFVPKGTNTGKYLKDDGTWSTISAGGLTYFTEAQSTASPNATVNVDSLTAIASTTNADVSIVPKGTGAILAAIPDGLGAGGNKRGTNAVDLQTSRVAAAEVASGGYSVLIGGYRTKATGSYSTVAGGQSCTASGDNSFVGGGYNGSASGVYSVTFGFQNQSIGTGAFTAGSLNVANGNYDVALGSSNTVTGVTGNGSGALGRSNTVTTGAYSFAIGGYNNIDGYNQYALGYACTLTSNGSTNGTRSVALGNNAHNNGFTRLVYGGVGWVLGDSQTSKVILTQRTTGASATRLVIYPQNTGTASAGNQITPQDNSCYRVKGTIVGKKSGSTDVGAWDIDFVMVRGVGAATTALVGVANVNLVTNLALWGTPTVTADTTIGCVNISVTGVATTNIQWNCTVDLVEVIYA